MKVKDYSYDTFPEFDEYVEGMIEVDVVVNLYCFEE